jgi:hypothetical protein
MSGRQKRTAKKRITAIKEKIIFKGTEKTLQKK